MVNHLGFSRNARNCEYVRPSISRAQFLPERVFTLTRLRVIIYRPVCSLSDRLSFVPCGLRRVRAYNTVSGTSILYSSSCCARPVAECSSRLAIAKSEAVNNLHKNSTLYFILFFAYRSRDVTACRFPSVRWARSFVLGAFICIAQILHALRARFRVEGSLGVPLSKPAVQAHCARAFLILTAAPDRVACSERRKRIFVQTLWAFDVMHSRCPL